MQPLTNIMFCFYLSMIFFIIWSPLSQPQRKQDLLFPFSWLLKYKYPQISLYSDLPENHTLPVSSGVPWKGDLAELTALGGILLFSKEPLRVNRPLGNNHLFQKATRASSEELATSQNISVNQNKAYHLPLFLSYVPHYQLADAVKTVGSLFSSTRTFFFFWSAWATYLIFSGGCGFLPGLSSLLK